MMNSYRARNVLAIISLSLLMFGCASLGTSNSDGVRYFSFEPPQGPSWRVLKNTSDALTLFREATNNEDESYVISIQAGKIPTFKTEAEFIEAVDKSRLKSLANMPKRYKSLESKIDPGNDSDFCFDSYAAVEDHEARRKSARTDMMISETASHTCRHPSNPNIVVNIYLSYRHYPADKDPEFMTAAQKIFTALKYQ